VDGGVVSPEKHGHLYAELAVFEVVGFEHFVVGEHLAPHHVWVLL